MAFLGMKQNLKTIQEKADKYNNVKIKLAWLKKSINIFSGSRE